jgi:hypothetical protein
VYGVLYRAGLEELFPIAILVIIGIVGKIIKKGGGGNPQTPAKSGSAVSPQDQLSQFLQSITDQSVAPVATVQRTAAPPQQRMPPPVPRQAAPSPQPPLDKTGEAAEKQRDGAMAVSADDMVRPRSRPSRGIARAIRRELVDSDGLRRAIVLSEILGPPVGLKKQS